MKGAATFRRRIQARLWWLALAGAIALVAWDAQVRAGRALALSRSYGVAVNAPPSDSTSPTGYALGRRSLVLPTLASDARHWVAQTQAMVATGETRVRRVDYDNAPAGRDVHWSSPFRWWLLGCAQLDHLATGLPLPLAIERAVLWANPVLFVMLLISVGPLVARRWGGFAAAVLVVGLVSALPFAVNFYATNADHHGAAQACALTSVLCLLLGNDSRRARAWFASAGIIGGIGLWISAASLVPVLVGVGGGGLARACLLRKQQDEAAMPWRAWSLAGGATSLLAYAIEYAPEHFGWRVEVNHPLYALAWIGGGELLRAAEQRLSGQHKAPSRKELATWAISAALIAAVPVLVLTLGERVFRLSDPFLQTLHSRIIAEFQSLPRYFAGRAWELSSVAQALPVLVALVFAGWCWRRQTETGARAQLVLALTPALVMLALAGLQIRWWGLAHGLVFLLMAQSLARLGGAPHTTRSPAVTARRKWRGVVLLALLPGLIVAMQATRQVDTPTESDIFHLAERDVAHRLRLRTGTESLVVAAAPDATTAIIYFASGRGLGTMYWENGDGLRTAARLFAATSAADARHIISGAGVTHVLLFSWDDTPADYVRLARGLPPGAPLPADSFAAALHSSRLPAWLRRLPHPLPAHPVFRGHEIRLFEVTGDRGADAIAVADTAYAIEMGQTEIAHALEPELAAHPESAAAMAALAGLQARRRDEAGFRRSLSRLEGLLPQTTMLPLEDHVRIAMVFGIGGRSEKARDVLRAAIGRTDERALRRLTPATMSDLVTLCDAFGVSFPTATLRALAAELMPPR